MRRPWTLREKLSWLASPHEARLNVLDARSVEGRRLLQMSRDQQLFLMMLEYTKVTRDVVQLSPGELAIGTLCYFGRELFLGNSYQMVNNMTLVQQDGASTGDRSFRRYTGPRTILSEYQLKNPNHIAERLASYAKDRALQVGFYEKVYRRIDICAGRCTINLPSG